MSNHRSPFSSVTILNRLTSLAARRCVIAGISILDASLVIVFAEIIHLVEENPVGLSLIRAGNGDVTIFVLTKLAGTAVVIYVLRELERRDQVAASIVTNGLLAFQLWLFWYLCISDYWTTRAEKIVMPLLSVVVVFFGSLM